MHSIKGDEKLNSRLRNEVGTLRGSILQAAEAGVSIPERFVAVPSKASPEMVITDKETGKRTTVALCHYYGVRKALQELFGK
jgi:hypothetical protein